MSDLHARATAEADRLGRLAPGTPFATAVAALRSTIEYHANCDDPASPCPTLNRIAAALGVVDPQTSTAAPVPLAHSG